MVEKTENGYMIPFKTYDTLLTKVIKNCENKDVGFYSYGGEDFPLIALHEIKDTLELNEEELLEQIKDFSEKEIIKHVKIVAYKDDKKYESVGHVLTRRGIQQLMFITNDNKIAKAYRRAVHETLSNLESTGKCEMQ